MSSRFRTTSAAKILSEIANICDILAATIATIRNFQYEVTLQW